MREHDEQCRARALGDLQLGVELFGWRATGVTDEHGGLMDTEGSLLNGQPTSDAVSWVLDNTPNQCVCRPLGENDEPNT